jgi:hypothetical protein
MIAGRRVLRQPEERVGALLRLANLPAQLVEVSLGDAAALAIVVDDEDRTAPPHVLADRRGKAGAIHRFGQELGGPERDRDPPVRKHSHDDDRYLAQLAI